MDGVVGEGICGCGMVRMFGSGCWFDDLAAGGWMEGGSSTD